MLYRSCYIIWWKFRNFPCNNISPYSWPSCLQLSNEHSTKLCYIYVFCTRLHAQRLFRPLTNANNYLRRSDLFADFPMNFLLNCAMLIPGYIQNSRLGHQSMKIYIVVRFLKTRLRKIQLLSLLSNFMVLFTGKAKSYQAIHFSRAPASSWHWQPWSSSLQKIEFLVLSRNFSML